jgi:hypothetical protein
MSHKIVILKPGDHYAQTDVNFDRSLSQIKALLQKHGCDRVAIQEDTAGDYPLVTLMFMKDNIPYIIEFPVTYLERSRTGRQLNMNISGRVVSDRVKAMLIEVEYKLADFSQAMMRFIALPTGDGHMISMEDHIMNQHAQLGQGHFDIKLLPAANGV